MLVKTSPEGCGDLSIETHPVVSKDGNILFRELIGEYKNKDTKIEAGRFSKPAVLQENRHLSNMRWKQILMIRADLDA